MLNKTRTHASEKDSAIVRKPHVSRSSRDREQVNAADALAPALTASGLSASDILALQRTAGNRAVQRMLRSMLHQPDSIAPPIIDQSHARTVHSSASMNPIQRKTEESEEALQGKFETVPRNESQTGLPDGLKTGIENLSGIAMDDVEVHYNSSRPQQYEALAYTQGSHIYLGPDQERHLAHEAWHVVQQKQGRVKPTLQTRGVGINADEGLENEANIAGSKAMRGSTTDGPTNGVTAVSRKGPAGNQPLQLEVKQGRSARRFYWYTTLDPMEGGWRIPYANKEEAQRAEDRILNPNLAEEDTEDDEAPSNDEQLDALLKNIGTSQLSDGDYNKGQAYAKEAFNFKGHPSHVSNKVARKPKQRLKEMFAAGATIKQLETVIALWGL